MGVIFAAIALLAFPQAASSGARAVIGTYTLYRPASLSRSQQVPIVLSCCGSPTAQTRSIMDGLADRFGFVVVFLAPTRTYNDAAHARGPGPPLPDSVWAGQVIDEVLASQNGNPARVYSTGVSAGGTFSYRLACDMPDKIAAIGSVAGLDVVPGCRPARPIAIIEIHGLLDTAIPFNGRNPGSITIPDVIAKWRAIDQCSATSTVTTSGALKEQVWSQCAGTTAVELATVSNAGHGWPMSVDTGGILWRFLNAHPLASAQSAATAKVLRASIAYRPTRHVVLRLDLGQASKLKLSLARGTRKVAARTIAQAKAGAGTYTLAIPRRTKRGTLKLRVVVQASGSQVTLTRKLRLVR